MSDDGKTALILGAGVMGTAFAWPLADAGTAVRLVGTHLDEAIVGSLKEGGPHPKLGLTPPPAVTPYHHHELAEAYGEGVDLVVVGVSSAGVAWTARMLAPLLRAGTPLLMLTKGLAPTAEGIGILPHDLARRLRDQGGPGVPIAAVGGPCIAGELAARRHTAVVFGHPDRELLERLLAMVEAPYYHARPSTDLAGLEANAALKNFMALGIGAAQGLLEREQEAPNKALMHNPAASLFGQALLELERLTLFLGGESSSAHGLPGAGDLYVTCQAGRNSRMGRLLGLGMTYARAKAERMPGDTVEGAELALALAPAFERLFGQGRLNRDDLPLTAALLKAVAGDRPLDLPFERFHRAAPSPEGEA